MSRDREVLKATIRRLIAEAAGQVVAPAGEKPARTKGDGPRVLVVYHTGLERLEEALDQVGRIEVLAEKTAFFQGPDARAVMCGDDLKSATGARCSLNSASFEGLGRVMDHSQVVLLPCLSLKVAVRVAGLNLDCQGSELVATALMKGKTVLAASDAFIAPGVDLSPGLTARVTDIRSQLEDMGLILSPTAGLAEAYQALATPAGAAAAGDKQPPAPVAQALSLVTGKDIIAAAQEGRTKVAVSAGGLVTPLALDAAKEYSVKIDREIE